MSRIASKPDGGALLGELAGGKPLREDDARLFRGAMGSLLIAGNMRDLPVAGQVHPGVQKRLRHAAPLMDSTMTEFIDGMKSMTPTARADLRSALRGDPELGTRILQAIDRETAAAGAPARRRTELLQLGDYVIGRLTHSPDLLMDEYVDKYEQQTAQKGSAARRSGPESARRKPRLGNGKGRAFGTSPSAIRCVVSVGWCRKRPRPRGGCRSWESGQSSLRPDGC